MLDDLLRKGARFPAHFLIATMFIFAFLISFTRIHSGDLWWSLAEGREILTSGRIPRTNLFSYTFPDHPWITTQWLFSVLVYRLWQVTGLTGLNLIKIVLFLGVLGVQFRTLKRQSGHPVLLVLALTLAILAVQYRILVRPHMFSMLGFALCVMLLSDHRRGHSRGLRFLPLITLLWSNLHAGVIFGQALIVLVSLEEGWNRLVGRFSKTDDPAPPALKPLLVWGTLALAAAFVNPMTAAYFRHAYSHLGLNASVPINEYLPPWTWRELFLFFYLLVFLYGIALGVKLLRRQWRLNFELAALPFLVLAFQYNRIVPYFVLLALIPIVAQSGSWRLFKAPAGSGPVLGYVLLGTMLVLAPLFLTGKSRFFPPLDSFGLGVNKARLPVQATEFLKANPLPGHMYNQYFWGGYLIWNLYPGVRVFCDGRIPAYPAEFHQADYLIATDYGAFQALDKAYDFQYLVIASGQFTWDLKRADSSVNWVPVYWDFRGHLILVRDTPGNQAYLDRCGYRYYTPTFEPGQYRQIRSSPAALGRLRAEIRQHQRWSPQAGEALFLELAEADYERLYGPDPPAR